MNVRDLIDELSKYPPHVPVKVRIFEVFDGRDESGSFVDDMVTCLSPDDAIEADRVIFEGNHVLIESK